MRQRLGIAQAIIHNPKVLILDEPMNGLDPIGIKELKDLLMKLSQKEKIAILISSHLLSELENICNRICIISDGKIIRDDTIKNIIKITENITYILEVDNIDLKNILLNYEILDDKHIKIKGNKEKITTILKTLLLNNISVLEMKKENLSLENAFLQMENKSLND